MNLLTRWFRTQKALTTILNNQQYIKYELDKLKKAVAWMNDWFAECKGCKKIYFKHLIDESNEGLCWYCVHPISQREKQSNCGWCANSEPHSHEGAPDFLLDVQDSAMRREIERRTAPFKEYKPTDKQKEEAPK